jgi:hypothetical protein
MEDLPGETTVSYEATTAFPLVSFVTMIAPSPDWINDVSGLPLHDGEAWIDRIEAPLWAWNVGTDSGDSYAAFHQGLQPQQSVRLAATRHFLTDRGLRAVGHVTIERVTPER